MTRFASSLPLLFAFTLLAGCTYSGGNRNYVADLAGTPSPADAAGVDAATPPDLAAPIQSPDLAMSPDLAIPPDLAVSPDLTIPPDLAMPDLRLPGCRDNTDCMNGFICCAGKCLDGLNDPTNCGACGNLCNAQNATTQCKAGQCALAACTGMWKDCDGKYGNGCEVDTGADVTNCGACGNACAAANANMACQKGGCVIANCKPGFANCDALAQNGCEVDTNADANNCGACANRCGNGRCTTKLLADMTVKPAGWNFNGNAVWDGTAKTAALTQYVTINQAGSVLYSLPAIFDNAQVDFDFKLDGSQGRADGIIFMLQTNGPAAVGRFGAGFAAAGLDGWGVELDLYNNNNCSDKGGNGNHAGVDTLKICDMVEGTPTPVVESADLYPSVGDIGDAKWRHATITVSGGAVTLVIENKPILLGVALPAFGQQTPYYFGFGGGTGQLVARQEIRNVAITFQRGQCL